MRLILAQYKGHINNNFIFAVNKQNIIFMPYEITVINLPLVDLIKCMQKEIGSWYKLAVFWDSYGYYVMKNKANTYDLYDALTNINTGTTYEAFEAIPDKYMYKPIQKYQRKLLLAKIRQCSK
jgi:hypothetical protein